MANAYTQSKVQYHHWITLSGKSIVRDLFITSFSKIWVLVIPNTDVVVCAHSCPTLGDPMNGSPPGSSVCSIFQARIMEWVAVSFSRESLIQVLNPHSLCLLGRREVLYQHSYLGSPWWCYWSIRYIWLCVLLHTVDSSTKWSAALEMLSSCFVKLKVCTLWYVKSTPMHNPQIPWGICTRRQVYNVLSSTVWSHKTLETTTQISSDRKIDK